MAFEARFSRVTGSLATLLAALTLVACAPGGEPRATAKAAALANASDEGQTKLGANQSTPAPTDSILFDCILDPRSGDLQTLEVLGAQFVSPTPHTLAMFVEPVMTATPALVESSFPLALNQLGTQTSWSGQYLAVAIDLTTPRAPSGYEGTIGVLENGALTPRPARCDLKWLADR